ncbi:MAG TPA: triple tyrosine motif-containing protein, partial [Candidatus Latescibacteria bacterium]|nr:triple tyrosine motif-containing protein [Candidatus Latescibacterota bacterium]
MSHYDGEIFQTLLQRDGLGSNIVVDILTAAYGSVWIATEGGATRYRPVTSPPKVRITDVVTDEHHGSVQALSIPSTLLAIHFEARSFKTHPANMQFVYRLRGHDETWHSTREHFVEYDGLDFGQYTFELRAIDRDLTYSTEAATVSIDVHPPYDQWALVGLVIVALAFAGVSGVYARRR